MSIPPKQACERAKARLTQLGDRETHRGLVVGRVEGCAIKKGCTRSLYQPRLKQRDFFERRSLRSAFGAQMQEQASEHVCRTLTQIQAAQGSG